MRKSLYIIFIVFVFILFLEISFRIIGFSPIVLNQKVVCKPEIAYSTDSLGITLKKGKYKININGCVEYNATHNSEGRRITSMKPVISNNKIFIFGCSFTYGVGVNDAETYPFLLQNRLQHYEVYNFSIPGSGTIHSYLKLKKCLEKGERPKIVVLTYATFHEERNQLTRSFESKLYDGMKLHEGFVLPKYYYPRCTIKNNSIAVERVDIVQEFQPIPFVNYSAIATFVDQIWDNIGFKKTDGFPVSKMLFKDFQKLAKQFHFKLIIADVAYNEKSKDIEAFCSKNNLSYVNISPDYSKGGYTLAPCDYHPNQSAHLIYARKLYEYINKLQ